MCDQCLQVSVARAVLAVFLACAANSVGAQVSSSVSTPDEQSENVARQVDIGGGRKLFLECRGSGKPVVILESGYHDCSQPWSLADATAAPDAAYGPYETEPFARPSNLEGFSFAELERLWPQGAEDLVKLEPDTPHTFATGSDHYIQIRQPDLVEQAIRLVLDRVQQK